MLIELGIVLLSIVPVLFVGKTLAERLTGTAWAIIPFQTLVAVAVAYIISPLVGNPTFLIAIMAITPLTMNLVDYRYNQWQKKRALNGDYGEETKWAAELVDSGDDEFARAIQQMPNGELAEIGIIAEDKEALRELTVERHKEIKR